MNFNAAVEKVKDYGVPISLNSDFEYKTTGTSSNNVVNYKDGLAVLKITDFNIRPISKMDSFLKNKYESNLPHMVRATENKSPKNTVNLEVKVLNNWHNSNVNSPEVFFTDKENIILMEHINGSDYKSLIMDGKYEKKHHVELMETLGQIEELTLSSRDLYNIHNDFHLGNFMYDNDAEKCIAIDPGLQFRKDLKHNHTIITIP